MQIAQECFYSALQALGTERRGLSLCCVGVRCGYKVIKNLLRWLYPKNSVKIAYKGAFYINKFQACKKGENCVGVDNT